MVPKGAQREPKSRPKSIKSGFWRGLERGPQKGTLSSFWDHFGDHMGDKIVEIEVQMNSKKSSENRHPTLVILGSIFGTLGLPWGTLWSAIRELFSGLVPGGLPRWILNTF